MRRACPTIVLVALALAAAGCGGEETVTPSPETVVGAVPTQQETTTQATTTQATTGGGTTTSGGGGGGAADGKSVFASNGCGSCHTYKPAGSNGKIGPDLDKLSEYAKQANQPLDAFVRTSIAHPKAYIQPGFAPVMPSYASLPKAELDALVTFLTQK